jgi:DNA-binding NtrC family response regulator
MSDPAAIRLLIVDDQPGIRQLCATIGCRMGLRCAQASSAGAALEEMGNQAAELMLADLAMGGSSGLELLAEVKRRWPLTEVALMSSYGSLESAVQAIRLGAYDFVVKPFRVEEFQRVLERMAEKARLVRENEILRTRLQTHGGYGPTDDLATGTAQQMGLRSLGRTKLAPTPPAPCTDLEEVERLTVQRVLEQVGGDKEQAQKLLGISRATLYRKIKRYGIEMRLARGKASGQETPEADKKKMEAVSQG